MSKRLESGGAAGNGSSIHMDVSIDGMIDGVEKVKGKFLPDAKIIPGHGPASTM